jgi:hypothetical protein
VSRLASPRLALAAFAAGAALMIAFEATLTRIAGLALLFLGIAAGVFAIATDEFVAGDEKPPSG